MPGTGMSPTDPCNVAGSAPNQAKCAASGKQKDSNMCNIMNPGVTTSTCSTQVQQSVGASVSQGLGTAAIIGIMILVVVVIVGGYMMFSGSQTTYTGAGRFGKFVALRKLFSRRR